MKSACARKAFVRCFVVPPRPSPPPAAPPPPTPDPNNDLSDIQRKHHPPAIGLMRPNGPALQHPAAQLLIEFATEGPATGIDLEHPLEVLQAAIERGAHPSAAQLEAVNPKVCQ